MHLNRKLTGRDKTLLLLLTLGILFAVYYFLVFQPISLATATASSSADTAAMGIEALTVQQAKIKEMRAAVDSTDVVPIPEYDNLSALIVFLESVLPPSADYQFNYAQPVPVTEGSSILARSMDLSFSAASYATARQVIDRLEQAPYRCLISALRIDGQDRGTVNQGPVQVSLSITFFENKVEETPQTPDQTPVQVPAQ